MPLKFGLLLPRSTDYPAMGFDMLEGLRAGLQQVGLPDTQVVTENIGFGEDESANYAKAERLLLQEDVQVMVAYCNAANAAPLYQLAASVRRPFIFLDAGMQLPETAINDYCYHISFQGAHACYLSGRQLASQSQKVLMATSFYDGGYRGPWSYHVSVAASGGAVCGNYVSGYKVAEFSINDYLDMLDKAGADCVAACFSTYLAELFFQSLKKEGAKAVSLPFYCAPYMAEEQLLAKCDFPGGTFHAFVPWASTLDNDQQRVFTSAMHARNKQPNLFQLFGWEAAIMGSYGLEAGAPALKGWHYNSPRGGVTVHQNTHHTYAPLYYGNIVAGENGKCAFRVVEQQAVEASDHTYYQGYENEMVVSGWRNNYFCI